ncbi:MAG: hypothetical protein A3C84_02055 [Candidatus Ryanbacteria bacterium RIFCSPHIGHO2_02_FULL_48_12]|uniref:Ribonuclease H1 N-terminal domain-containing protein n=1 Tax=Candidatus Ryanbacteria bacterium RIFCSPHIGHO2_01_FULL_48_27 TaxID=1802115 RepID=A0A1G2G5F8_9BACT|nr:MAG: hypothetical protein A2756_01575 [Candidatus Ryanbacteria bacterium RIFCSPHIGHO2_01_FULL_48_27]OGZ50525.1 MAG: hypothetical protein A3C84_02055 [Candidatus Ryanbacteria bacterium RIFCSPHIGHO2_02_FULL_48_12]
MPTVKKYYAYILPSGEQGIVDAWPACQKLVSGKPNARYKGFTTEANAQAWLATGGDYAAKHVANSGIYFDAGTGRGDGVEISVTDETGADLLQEILPTQKINRHGKHLIQKDVSNNFGELLACRYALELALKRGVMHVFGDSKLIIDYWSKGYINVPNVTRETLELASRVADLRKEFEAAGGRIEHISGDDNPADLGFHK